MNSAAEPFEPIFIGWWVCFDNRLPDILTELLCSRLISHPNVATDVSVVITNEAHNFQTCILCEQGSIKFDLNFVQAGSMCSNPRVIPMVYPDEPLGGKQHSRVDDRIQFSIQPGNRFIDVFLPRDRFTAYQVFTLQITQLMFLEVVLDCL